MSGEAPSAVLSTSCGALLSLFTNLDDTQRP
uniref:Uncharacterized protein n=1 Tax=Anguilla anguilla TaxID=7936 RepID=A0A0E9VDK0_ANGAN